VHVLVDYHRKRPDIPGMVVHQSLFAEQDVVLRDGLRVMVLEYALTELLCRESRRVALACADQALALTPPDQRAEFRAELLHRIETRRDPRGTRRSRILLGLATGLAESPAESWLLLDLFDGGISVPRQQVPVLDINGREIYRLDFAWEEPRVAVEYDGYAAHVDRLVRDAARDEDLRRRGWTVIHADADDLREPTRLHTEIRRAFRRRRFAA
jgi:very-short-patch-repair endonuclease